MLLLFDCYLKDCFYFVTAKINSAKSPPDIKSTKINSAKYTFFYPSSAIINSALINFLKVVPLDLIILTVKFKMRSVISQQPLTAH